MDNNLDRITIEIAFDLIFNIKLDWVMISGLGPRLLVLDLDNNLNLFNPNFI